MEFKPLIYLTSMVNINSFYNNNDNMQSDVDQVGNKK